MFTEEMGVFKSMKKSIKEQKRIITFYCSRTEWAVLVKQIENETIKKNMIIFFQTDNIINLKIIFQGGKETQRFQN